MEKLYCKGGGCTAKLGAGILSHILERLPKQNFDENLMVGFDAKDDAAVYKLTDDIAFVQTLDFFPPMVEDPYTFGQIAAANALSDIYAMGGEVKTALNIVCFPQSSDLNILGEIMRGGLEKVKEAGVNSIVDTDVKYGLSVTGIVNPNKIYSNNTGKAGDRLILTKRLGVGIICTAARIGEADEDTLNEAVDSMRTLNKYACDISKKYDIHACTDITGFGFLGHLMEMMGDDKSCEVYAKQISVFEAAKALADEFLITAGGQRNRNYVGENVIFEDVPFAMEEILFDPQTSGGLLLAVGKEEADVLLNELKDAGMPAAIVGEIRERENTAIKVADK